MLCTMEEEDHVWDEVVFELFLLKRRQYLWRDKIRTHKKRSWAVRMRKKRNRAREKERKGRREREQEGEKERERERGGEREREREREKDRRSREFAKTYART